MNRTVGAERRDRGNELEKLSNSGDPTCHSTRYGVRESPDRIDWKMGVTSKGGSERIDEIGK